MYSEVSPVTTYSREKVRLSLLTRLQSSPAINKFFILAPVNHPHLLEVRNQIIRESNLDYLDQILRFVNSVDQNEIFSSWEPVARCLRNYKPFIRAGIQYIERLPATRKIRENGGILSEIKTLDSVLQDFIDALRDLNILTLRGIPLTPDQEESSFKYPSLEVLAPNMRNIRTYLQRRPLFEETKFAQIEEACMPFFDLLEEMSHY